jgi:hypothetical protein
MERGMFVFGLIGIVLISLPLTSFAQGTGGVTTGCYVDVIRDCAGMAANATPPKPSVACKDRNCVEVLGTLRCEASVGLNPPPFITITSNLSRCASSRQYYYTTRGRSDREIVRGLALGLRKHI